MANQTRLLKRCLEHEGCQVRLIATNAPYRPHWIGRIRYIRAVFRLIAYLVALLRGIKGSDVVHMMANSGWSWFLFTVPAVLIASLFNVPVVVNYRGGHAESFFARSWSRVAPVLRMSSAIIVPSPYLQRVFANREFEALVIPNLLDGERFRAQPTVRSFDDSPHLLVTRNLEKIYGIDTVITAFAALLRTFPGARLTIAGKGPEHDSLVRLAEQLEVTESVALTGSLPPEQIATLYQQADLMVNASRVDNSPNAIIEALASGLPVVSSDAGGIPDLLRHRETGLLVEPDDPASLCQAMKEVLSDQSLRQQLIQNGLEFSQRYDWRKLKLSLFGVYQDAIGFKQGAKQQ